MPVSGNPAPRVGIRGFPEPFWAAHNAALYLGDVRACLRAMPTRSVHTCVTSPPYWGLRDYGTGTWEGGSVDCDHVDQFRLDERRRQRKSMIAVGERADGSTRTRIHDEEAGKTWQYNDVCKKCGARRTDMQIGAEPSPDCGTHGQAQCGDCFVCSLVGVFREVWRVLRDDGTCWLNLGDSYAGSATGHRPGQGKVEGFGANRNGVPRCELPAGNLVGVPWRVALALQADGWVLRQDIIWYSPNKMPESVQNRCTKSHEHIFLLAKGGDYYFDGVAIEEPFADERMGNPGGGGAYSRDSGRNDRGAVSTGVYNLDGSRTGKNKRDVWIVPTTGYPGAHFAVYSPRLITPCILAGTSEHGVCAACGRPWERVVARVAGNLLGLTGGEYDPPGQSPHSNARKDRDRSIPSNRNGITGSLDEVQASRETVGWRKVCGCQTDEVVPAVVLDPFVGSGTTVATALELGRAGVGIDLSEVYLRENAVPRIEASMRGERVPRKLTVAVVPDTLPVPKKLR